MAYKMSDVGGWGTGALGDITNPPGQVNSYANVTAISTNTVTIGTPSNGIYETFVVGKEILLHVSAVLSGTDATKLGKYLVATITGVSGSVLTLSKDVAANLVANADLSTLVVQAITVAQFGTLTLSSGSITPPVYSTTAKYGGVIALKCKTELIFSGGSINLVDKGIPTASSAMRPLTAQETEMISATSGHSTGFENHVTSRQALLNCGDGVAMIFAKKTTVSSASSRIGSTAAGVQYYPYAYADNSPAEVLGGSTILLASETIANFDVGLISKGRGTGTGYGRCYIATETLLPNDEGLYAQDCLSNPARIRKLGIKDFGDGHAGSVTLSGGGVLTNTSGAISTINSSRNVITLNSKVNASYATFAAGEIVCVHAIASKAGAIENLGCFFLTKILNASGYTLTLDTPVPDHLSIDDYYLQAFVLPQFKNVTLGGSYCYFNPTNQADLGQASKVHGGIVAFFVQDTLTINSSTVVDIVGIGLPDINGAYATQRPFVPTQCPGQQKDRLLFGRHGNTCVMIIANKIVDNRTPANTTGFNSIAKSGYCGNSYNYDSGNYGMTGGYAGSGYTGGPWKYNGQGYQMGIGFSGNNTSGSSYFFVIDTLTSFKTRAFLWNVGLFWNGPGYGMQSNQAYPYNGGGAGTTFFYVNNLVSPDYTGAVI